MLYYVRTMYVKIVREKNSPHLPLDHLFYSSFPVFLSLSLASSLFPHVLPTYQAGGLCCVGRSWEIWSVGELTEQCGSVD